MGVFTYENEISTSIPPARFFKAFILNFHNLMPKAVPFAIKKVEVEGDGGPGTIKKVYFAEGSEFKSSTLKVELLDKENFMYNYSVIEGDLLMDILEKITYDTKLVASPDGGTTVKTTITFYTKVDNVITEEKFKTDQERAKGMFKAVEAYLLANHDEYN